MALKTMAAIVVRPRTVLWVGATLLAAAALTGCSGRRTSYRPVYTSPATVSTPCKNCGPGGNGHRRIRPAAGHDCTLVRAVDAGLNHSDAEPLRIRHGELQSRAQGEVEIGRAPVRRNQLNPRRQDQSSSSA